MRATVWLTVGPLWSSRSAIRARIGTTPSSSSSRMVRRYISVVSINPDMRAPRSFVRGPGPILTHSTDNGPRSVLRPFLTPARGGRTVIRMSEPRESLADRYFDAAIALLHRVRDEEAAGIQAAADAIGDAIAAGGRVFVFGAGHSSL